MKPREIKGARSRLGLHQKDIAEYLNMTLSSYRSKESGQYSFTDEQKIKLGDLFGWSMDEINEYLYDGILPLDKSK